MKKDKPRKVEMAKHAPGPWTTYTQGNHIRVGRGFSHVVASVKLDKHFPNHSRASANFIAAAPEMFEALINIQRAFAIGLPPTKKDIQLVNEAIAKATGGTDDD